VIEVEWYSGGRVSVEGWEDGQRVLHENFENQDVAHTWLCDNGYKIVGGKSIRKRGDHISGFYVKVPIKTQ
jgi:hypothetical protein